MPPPAATSTTPTWQEAARACWYATQAYSDAPEECIVHRDERDVEYAIWDAGDRLVIAFAGSTIEWRDWARNLFAFPSRLWIHRGALDCYYTVFNQLQQDLAAYRKDRPIMWVGHSQGGSTAKIAYHFDGRDGDSCITFGAPPAWTRGKKSRIRGMGKGIHEYRTAWDTVPRLLCVGYGPDTPGIHLPTGRHAIHAYAAAIAAMNR
jgi:hypothetical protein